MSLNPRCYALSQISFLVANINKRNYKDNCTEIARVCIKNRKRPTHDHIRMRYIENTILLGIVTYLSPLKCFQLGPIFFLKLLIAWFSVGQKSNPCVLSPFISLKEIRSLDSILILVANASTWDMWLSLVLPEGKVHSAVQPTFALREAVFLISQRWW